MGKYAKEFEEDILFKNDDFVFSYRVGGILIRNGKILFQSRFEENGNGRKYKGWIWNAG